jgi:hypothetical protein
MRQPRNNAPAERISAFARAVCRNSYAVVFHRQFEDAGAGFPEGDGDAASLAVAKRIFEGVGEQFIQDQASLPAMLAMASIL